MPACHPGILRLIVASILLLATIIFIERAFLNARVVNTRIDRTDQNAYIDHALRLKESGFQYDLPRNRMPAYPWFLALLSREGDKPDDLFARGKVANIILTVACLGVVGVVYFRSLPGHAALNATLLPAFTVFLFKAPHVQAEVLFYTLNFAGFVLAWRLFRSPGWLPAAALGLVAAAAHLTKASVLPGLFCFGVFFMIDAVWTKPPFRARAVLVRAGMVALAVAGFLAVTAPYLVRSKELHGSFLYNVNSSHYFWLDSWKECLALTQKAKDLGGWSKLPPEEQPGPSFFLERHGWSGVGKRLVEGSLRVIQSMRAGYGYAGFLAALSVTWMALAVIRGRGLLRRLRHRPAPRIALACYFGGYFLLLAWYSQIIDGNRFVLALFLPAVFTLMAGIQRLCSGLRFSIAGNPLPAACLIQCLLSLWLAVEITIICTQRIGTVYGGG